MKITKLLKAAAMGGALAATTANAQLEIPNDQYWDSGDPERWRTILAFPMLWAPSIGLDIGTPEGTVESEISFGDILKNLQMGFMGELYITKAWFGIFLKGMYMDIQTDELKQQVDIGPVGVDLGITPTLQMGLYDMGFSWRVWRNLRIITLARATAVEAQIQTKGSVDTCLTVGCLTGNEPPVSQPFDETVEVDPGLSWDYNLGLEYGWWMGDTKRHGINVYGDAAVDGDSQSAWMVEARYMYRVSKLNNFWLGWRHYEMKTQEDDNGNDTTVAISGPLAGWAFSF